MRSINKTELYELLKRRKQELEEIVKKSERVLADAPSGRIEVSKHKGSGTVQFYHIDDKRQYIDTSQTDMVESLVKKEYYRKMLRISKEEISSINRYLKKFSEDQYIKIFENMHPEKKRLIVPQIYDDTTYVEFWNNVEYVGKEFRDEDTTEYYTERGERVRSKSEILISNSLKKSNIPYRYEYPIRINNVNFYPDFYILNIRKRREYIWEHFGRMDDIEYARNAVRKIQMYEDNGFFPGINLIVTFETSKCPIGTKTIQENIRMYLL